MGFKKKSRLATRKETGKYVKKKKAPDDLSSAIDSIKTDSTGSGNVPAKGSGKICDVVPDDKTPNTINPVDTFCDGDNLLLDYPDNEVSLSCLDTAFIDWNTEFIFPETCDQIDEPHVSTVVDEDSAFWELPTNIDCDYINNDSLNAELVDSDGVHGHEFYVILDKVYQYNPSENLDEFVKSRRYDILKTKVAKFDFYNFQFVRSKFIRLVEFYDSQTYLTIKTSITILNNFQVEIFVHDQKLPEDHFIYQTTKKTCTNIEDVKSLVAKLTQLKICIGNPERNFQEKLSPTYPSLPSDHVAGYRETNKGAICDDNFAYTSTIRSVKCTLYSESDRCKNCQTYRRTLLKQAARNAEKVPTPEKNWLKSHKGNSQLRETEKIAKLNQMTSLSTDLKCKIKSLEKKITTLIQKEGIGLKDSDNGDFSTMMSGLSHQVESQFPDQSSYQRIFWEQQMKFNKLKDKRGMRWHPLMIKWCLLLKSKSSTTYDALRQSGFISLPSERLLYDYSHVIKSSVGFNHKVMEALITEVEKKGLTEEWQRYCGILQDEIKIKEDLVYDKHSGELIGFVNLDDIGNSISNMDQCIKDEQPKLAKNVLVLMVRGIANDLKFPFAHFATNGVTSDQLFPILWKAVEILEVDVNLKVLFITSDGASPNRRFIRLHAMPNQMGIVYKADNRFSDDDRQIYFISDPPHLLKTARNCFSNSYSHKNTRKLWKNGKTISWMHIVNLFKDHCTGGLRLCPKLSRHHIDISSFGCMKVSFAAQVLSSTVANALEMVYGQETSETVQFIRHMNKFFDCLNTRNLYEAGRTRNDNLAPYLSENDPRLDYLMNDFLGYFNQWKADVNNKPDNPSKSEKAAMQLSFQTLQGFEITVKSIVECVRLMLSKGAPFVLTEHFNQDPIEQHFGMVRASGGCNTNPTLQQFNNSIGNLRVAGSQALAPFRGNTKRNLERNFCALQVCEPIPKKKRV